MFERLDAPAELEERVLAFWDAERVFQRVLDKPASERFVFYEGPPTANGTPHNGHVLTRVVKDVFPRYHTMRGRHVGRKAGWDTHGLPVEVEVEKQLGIHGREAIEGYGLDAFARQCVASVFKYTKEWEQLTKQIGFWVDLDDAYVTYHREYIESVWWALSQLFEKGLLYKGHKVVWWWPQGGTTLSAAEVGLGYKEVVDPAITVRLRDAQNPKISYLAWTTTPWTLPSNVALAVGADIDYAYCEDPQDPTGEVVVAVALAESFGLTPKRTVKGRDLLGRRYVPLFDFGRPQGGDGTLIVAGHHVTTTAGTGIVHIAPAFGEDDMQIAKEQGLGLLQWIDPSGRFLPGTGAFAGRFCKDADNDIIADLKARGLLFKRDTIRHDYPFCWRADQDPLIQYARPAWFIRTTERIHEAIGSNAKVGWIPEHIKEGRFGDFLRNNVDWALSRERFWGTPLNIWICETCEHHLAPASTEEILALNPDAFDPSVDKHLQIHRPWIDRVTLPCPRCKSTMRRVPEVIDCWFDSGCMPFAQWGFPHRGIEEMRAAFPADFISEAVDQTRGWFYSLLMIATLVFDDETVEKYGLDPAGPRPYRNCLVLGHVCDADGKKESKSKGNYTSPNLVLRGRTELDVLPDPTLKPGTIGVKPDQVRSLGLADHELVTVSRAEAPDASALIGPLVSARVGPKDTFHLHPDDLERIGLPRAGGRAWFRIPIEPPGADAFRWLFCAASPASSNTRLSLRNIRDRQRDFLLRLRNVYQFFAIYADIAAAKGDFDPKAGAPRPVGEREELDRWIVDRLTDTVGGVTGHMDGLRLYEAAELLSSFVEDLSNWYVRRSRARFWGEGRELQDALWTLYEVLVEFSRLIAPFVPFTAEAIYRGLVVNAGVEAPISVHLTDFPVVDESKVDRRLRADMALVRTVASLGLAARANSKVKVRQPLRSVTVVLADPSRQAVLEAHADVLREELNVREIRFAQDAATFVSYQVKPDFKRLGPKLGQGVKECAGQLSKLDGAAVKSALDADGLTLTLSAGPITLTAEDVVVTVLRKEGYESAASPEAVVALETELDDDLRAEGLVRELVSRVQGLRKELDLGYTQRIALTISADALADALSRHGGYLQAETLATSLEIASPGPDFTVREWDVEGHPVVAGLRPV